MVFGANTFREFMDMLGSNTEESEVDAWGIRMRNMPTTVVSSTLTGPLDWPDATVVAENAVDVVARLKEESEVPLRSHGSLSMNWALMAAGLVDRVQVTLFPVISGRTGTEPIFGVRTTSTWSCSSPGRSTVAPKSSSTDPRSTDPYAACGSPGRVLVPTDSSYCSGSASGSCCSSARRACLRIRLPITLVKTRLMTRPTITTPPAMSPIVTGPSGLLRTIPLR